MKLIVKIGLIALLLIFNYQGVDADIVSSAIDRYATTTEHQDNMASDHGTLDTMSFTHSLLTGQQQVLAKLMPDNPIHCVFPASHYFVFTLKRILI